MRLSELIRQYRLENGLSQRQFAAKCDGITNGYISMLENEANPHTGKPSTPSLEKLSAIARGMGLTLSELVTRADDLDINIPTSSPPPVSIPHRDTRPYSPARSMVAIVGSVRCGPGGAGRGCLYRAPRGPPNDAYTNTCPGRACVRDERQQAAMMSRLFYIKKSPGRSRGYCLTLRRPSGRRAAHPSRRSSPRSCSGSAVRTQPPRWPLNPP